MTGARRRTISAGAYGGPVAPVLRAAADHDPVDITARPADLDELFLAYYRHAPRRSPPMRADVTRLDLRLRRRSLLGYTAGMALYALVIVALYPQFKNSLSLDQLTRHGSAVAALFGATGSLTSPAGWLNANLYANFLPLIMLLITIGYGAAVHRRPGRGRHPVPDRNPPPPPQEHPAPEIRQPGRASRPARRRHDGLRGHRPRLRPDHPGRDLAGITIGLILVGIDFGLLALAVGCWTGSRGTALGITSAAAAASYLISSLAPAIGWLRPARYASLLYWSVGSHQVTTGLTAASIAVLAAAGIALLSLAAFGFSHLDLH